MQHVTVEALSWPQAPELVYLLKNLRSQDQFEFDCVGLYNRLQPIPLVLGSDDAWLFRWKNEPAFICGTVGTYERHLFGFGTDHTRRVIPFVTRWVDDFWLPDHFQNRGTRRIQVRVPEKSKASVRWLQDLGMAHEARISHATVNGEHMLQLAYTSAHYEDDFSVLLRQAPAAARTPADAS